MGHRELFPTDRVLVARMVAAAFVTLAVVAGAVLVVAVLGSWKVQASVAGAAAIGVICAVVEQRRRSDPRELTREDAPELHAVVERLCVVGDLPMPRLVLEPEHQPNSWIVSLGRHHARLHVTQGLLDRLEGAELEGVIAHELAHVAQRDAAVMTVVGGPAAVLLAGGATLTKAGGFPAVRFGGALAFAIGWLGSLGSRILTRHRELAADAGAVALTGNPAALASALTKVADGLRGIPAEDLRAVAVRDAFHLLPAKRSSYRLPATHPPLHRRIARLERLEARLQSARPALRD